MEDHIYAGELYNYWFVDPPCPIQKTNKPFSLAELCAIKIKYSKDFDFKDNFEFTGNNKDKVLVSEIEFYVNKVIKYYGNQYVGKNHSFRTFCGNPWRNPWKGTHIRTINGERYYTGLKQRTH